MKDHEWRAIQDYVEETLRKMGQPFSTDVVTKRDSSKGLIWTSDFGDTPIPIVSLDIKVKYYDTQPDGHLNVRATKNDGAIKQGTYLLPEIGDRVLLAHIFSSREMPLCLGVIQDQGL